MIDSFTFRTAARFDDALVAMFRLRHRLFIEQEGYRIPTYRGLEFDDYDTLETRYLVYRDRRRRVLGTLRFFPTTSPYMIQRLWPRGSRDPLPCSRNIWEATRIGVAAPRQQRREIVRKLVVAQIETAERYQLCSYIGVMPERLWQSVYERNAWPVRYLGPPFKIEHYPDQVRVGEMPVSKGIAQAVRRETGLDQSVLSMTDFGADEGTTN